MPYAFLNPDIHKDKNHDQALRENETGDILDPSMIPDGVDPLCIAQPVCR